METAIEPSHSPSHLRLPPSSLDTLDLALSFPEELGVLHITHAPVARAPGATVLVLLVCRHIKCI